MTSVGISKEKADVTRIALQQSRAIVVGTQVIYITYEPLLDMATDYLVGE